MTPWRAASLRTCRRSWLLLRAEGERADYPAGTTVYRAGSGPQAGLVVGGLLRVYLMSVEGPAGHGPVFPVR